MFSSFVFYLDIRSEFLGNSSKHDLVVVKNLNLKAILQEESLRSKQTHSLFLIENLKEGAKMMLISTF